MQVVRAPLIFCRGLLPGKEWERKEKEDKSAEPRWQYPQRWVGTVLQQTFGCTQAQVRGGDM